MQRLKAFSARIIAIQSFVLLAVLYILLVPVLSWVIRIRKTYRNTGWLPWGYQTNTVSDVQLQ